MAKPEKIPLEGVPKKPKKKMPKQKYWSRKPKNGADREKLIDLMTELAKHL